MKMKDKIKRRNTLSHFGFGTDRMKDITVCAKCNHPESSKKMFCSKCGTRLPRTNLFDIYKTQHKSCLKCGTILSDSMGYCPHCGIRVNDFVSLKIGE